ncbi:LuxR C-terminal-related transcriptional regulator [Roseomonas sp. ACRSG]|nr:LuxR C-terminal-related transcriptional regulator [Roseomonas sp. ACRSG]
MIDAIRSRWVRRAESVEAGHTPGPIPGDGEADTAWGSAAAQPEEVPVACFSIAGHSCEVVPDHAAPAGKEILGSLALCGRRYVVLKGGLEQEMPNLLDVLTPRELEIALLVYHGWDAKAIGRRLDISFHTVRVHTGRIYAKLGMNKQSELVACVARQWWLVEKKADCGRSLTAHGRARET